MSIAQFCKLLEASSIGTNIRESSFLFPVIEGLHVLGLSISVGLILISDLRLAGVLLRKRTAREVWENFLPWLVPGFILMVITGALLFWSHAFAAYQSIAFRTKLILLVLAAVNAAVYHLTVYRRMNEWDTAAVPPLGARFAGWASVVLWVGIITMGRVMAYTF
jgi:heme/copper-type cytochrome/quinol oxidase subunit 4